MANNQVTRGGVSKRIFKPNIPLKVDRSKEDEQQQPSKADDQSNSTKRPFPKPHELKKNNLKNKPKEYIQIDATFEGFKSEPKARTSNGYATSSHGISSNSSLGIKKEGSTDKRFKSDDLRKERSELRRVSESAVDDDYLSDDLDEDELNLEGEDMPISWSNYSKMINQFHNLNKDENTVEEKIENGRLILMPCIFGNVTGDTGYKLQVLKSGKMRLVDKRSGFTIDLLNTGELEHDAIKEVVELDDGKLLRYGSLNNSDIYSPVRSLNSDYNSILQD